MGYEAAPLGTGTNNLGGEERGSVPGDVATEIQDGAPKIIPAYGSKEMPVWGPIFMTMGGHSTAQVQLRIRNLTNYLESI